jgi:hypothetical protein
MEASGPAPALPWHCSIRRHRHLLSCAPWRTKPQAAGYGSAADLRGVRGHRRRHRLRGRRQLSPKLVCGGAGAPGNYALRPIVQHGTGTRVLGAVPLGGSLFARSGSSIPERQRGLLPFVRERNAFIQSNERKADSVPSPKAAHHRYPSRHERQSTVNPHSTAPQHRAHSQQQNRPPLPRPNRWVAK